MLPAFEADVPEATRYSIDVRVEFDPLTEQATVEGTVRVQFSNRQEVALDEIVLMLWPNHPQYRAEMKAGPALIDGQLFPAAIAADGITHRYELLDRLQAGETIDLSLTFKVDTSGPIGGSDPRRFGITQGVLFAPTFYPLIPPLRDGVWQVQQAPMAGDTTNSDIATYEVRVTTSSEHVVVATGTEVGRRPNGDGTLTLTYVSGPARDFALALGPFVSETMDVSGVSVTGWVIPEHEADLGRMVEAAALQLELLSRLIGPYPYRELDLVDVPGAFGGIEYPGLVSVGTLGSRRLISPTVHEVGHQWFYGMIGDDQLLQPWMDEAAATYTEILYYEEVMGAGTATGILSDFREQVRSHPNPATPIGLPVGEYASTLDYALFVYRKGALFFDALRAELGDEVFFEFMRTYYDAFRYKIATAKDFQITAESTCACDLSAIFDLWVHGGGLPPGF